MPLPATTYPTCPRSVLQSSSHVICVRHFFPPFCFATILWQGIIVFDKVMTHRLSHCLVTSWQDWALLLFCLSLEVHHSRKLLPSVYIEVEIFWHHTPMYFSHCAMAGWWTFLENAILVWSQSIIWLAANFFWTTKCSYKNNINTLHVCVCLFNYA